MTYVITILLALILSAVIAPKATKTFVIWSLAIAAVAAATLGAIWVGMIIYDFAHSTIANAADFANMCSAGGWALCGPMLSDAYLDPANAGIVRMLAGAAFMLVVLLLVYGVDLLREKWQRRRELEELWQSIRADTADAKEEHHHGDL